MKKKIVLLVSMVCVFAMMLVGCGTQLPEQFDEDAIKAQAETIVGYINDNDMEGFCQVPMSAGLKDALTVEYMQSIVDQYIGSRGDFVEYKSNVVVASKDSDGNECAVAVVIAKYTNQKVTYTISLNEQMELIGFYLK